MVFKGAHRRRSNTGISDGREGVQSGAEGQKGRRDQPVTVSAPSSGNSTVNTVRPGLEATETDP